MTEGIKTVNSTIRTLLLLGLATVICIGGYYAYNEYAGNELRYRAQLEELRSANEKMLLLESDLAARAAQIDQLTEEVALREEQIVKLETAMHLLKTDQRLARLNVLGITRDEDGKAVESELEFVELSPQGDPLTEPERFTLPGDVIYIDNWVIKFDDAYIESADLERGTSLCLFRRIFSEEQTPTQGISLDKVGMRPQAYASGGQISPFEATLWRDFWEFANDPQKASEKGIRAANGEAVSIKVREGHAYNITLRASGGLSIEPLPGGANPDPVAKRQQEQAESL